MHWSSFPRLKLVESVGNAPTSACLQGKRIAYLPRPRKEMQKEEWRMKKSGLLAAAGDLARRLGAAPSPSGFGDSTAQAGARRSNSSFLTLPSAIWCV